MQGDGQQDEDHHGKIRESIERDEFEEKGRKTAEQHYGCKVEIDHLTEGQIVENEKRYGVSRFEGPFEVSKDPRGDESVASAVGI